MQLEKGIPEARKHQALSAAFNHITAYLDGLETAEVGATVQLSTLRERFAKPLPSAGTDATEVIDELVQNTAGGLLGCAGGRFYAWVIGGGFTSALAADWLTATWDQNAALYACSPAASVVEEVAGGWLKELFNLPSEASFAFTTGCQLAHFTSLAAARYAVLKRANWDVNEDGLFGAPRIRIIVSDQRHASVDRAVRYLGLGNRSIVPAPIDDAGMVDPTAFAALLASSDAPTIVVLDAADLNIAAIDPFATLIPIAKAAGAWVHVDGAFGLFAAASANKRHLVRGLQLADSWATDGHKWLNIPFDCGFAFIRDREAHKKSMTITASYIVASTDSSQLGGASSTAPARDQIDWNPEWSRKARGFPVYAALRELGSSGVEDLVDRYDRTPVWFCKIRCVF
jgi:glutamate/tyrosine decarboxylase-like PLP-dependent enzyme